MQGARYRHERSHDEEEPQLPPVGTDGKPDDQGERGEEDEAQQCTERTRSGDEGRTGQQACDLGQRVGPVEQCVPVPEVEEAYFNHVR